MKKKSKKNKKNSKSKKRTVSKSRVSAKAKLSARSGKKKISAKRKQVAPRRPIRETEEVMGSQSVETVPLSTVRPKARTARVGGGAGDYRGISVVEGADSESPKELLEEGQTFEAGIVDAVQNAPNADEGEIRTREVPEDDVPLEYDDEDRP
jgi:hypothetical protein